MAPFIKILVIFIFCFGSICCTDTVTTTETASEVNKLDSTAVKTPIFHRSHEPRKQSAPFSDVVQIGELYLLSGQIGMDHSTRELVTGGIEAETRQTLENIKSVLQQHNLDMRDVVKATVILESITDFEAFNAIYTTYFPQRPARTTFAAKGLAKGAKIEIEVMAIRSK
ncbi:MAG: RidA family protein [Flavobacteriales bacterium]|jgi:2-iminobutanoate/2-iminopropanoate deaminase|uniref:RidA family protein n=1 Tax=Candidatus Ulvibacter alkanivorans TaxID=2267620 RepID=UPI000DF3AC41|nr:RidA family protein [Candidatus Ulvibacter alkanivorans]MCH2490678.1 RidA family protein [Flavobacteriales bacterium]